MLKRAFRDPAVFVTVLLIFIFLLSAGSFLGSLSSADIREDRGISIEIEREKGQDVLFVNDTESFNVHIVGRFEVGGEVFRAENADNWTLTTETDMEGEINPEDQESNTTNEFEVDVTISEKGTGQLTFTAYCTKGETTRYFEREVEIKVVEPESISFELNNPTTYELEDFTVDLYINGRLINTITIENLGPEETRDVEIKWSSHDLEGGEHTLEIRTDYGFNGEEDTLVSRTFYVEEDTNTALYGGIAAIAIVSAVIVFFLYRRKKKRRRRPW